jgi:hypothetical protein
MFKMIGMGLLIIAGLCLTAIGLRKKPRLFGSLFSPELNKDINSTDKYLAVAGLIFFLIAMLFLVILHY